MSLAGAFESVSRRAAPAAMGLLFPILLMAQNYVFGPNIRVNDDSPGTAFHSTYSPGQHLIACRGDTVYLVWRDDRVGYSRVYFARSNDAGQHFLPNVCVDRAAGEFPSLALDDSGTIHVSWMNGNSSDGCFTYYAKSTDGGQNFLTPMRACDSLHMTQPAWPSIAVSKSGRYVYVVRSEAWRDPGGGQSTYQIKLSRSTDGGATFLTPDTRVCPDTTMNHYNPTIAVFNDTIVLAAWSRNEDSVNGYNVYFARSTDGGSSFEPAILLSDSTIPQYYDHPSLGVDSTGRVFVVFDGLMRILASADTGRTFCSRGILNGASIWVGADGRLFLVSTGWTSEYEVNFAYSPDAGQTFTRALVSDTLFPDMWQDWPTVCANRDGRVFVAWQDDRDAPQTVNDDIYFATGTMAGIEEASRLAGTQLECSALPSPARGPVRIDYLLPSAGRTRIEVLDQSGRSVAVLRDGTEQAGRFSLVWNGLDVRGNRVNCGVYFIRLVTPAGCRTRKVVRIE